MTVSAHEPIFEGSFAARRERLRRAVEDGERLYRKRMHDPDGPGLPIKDDFRVDGILTLDLTDALGLVDSLASALADAHHALRHLMPRPYADESALDDYERWELAVIAAGLGDGEHPCSHGAPCPLAAGDNA